MLKLDVDLNYAGIQEFLKEYHVVTRKFNEPLGECREVLRASIVENFERGGRPKWDALHERTLERKRREGSRLDILRESDTLYNSFAGGGAGSTMVSGKIGKTTMIVGTNVPYAFLHQYGFELEKPKVKWKDVKKHGAQSRMLFSAIAAKQRKEQMIPGQRATRIPARPFLMVQPEDWYFFRLIFEAWIERTIANTIWTKGRSK